MNLKDRLFTDNKTKSRLNYNEWCFENKIHELVGIPIDEDTEINSKIRTSLYKAVDPNNVTPFPPELDDLTRLHFFIRNRKVTTILEFGLGKSTIVFADAIAKNKKDYGDYVSTNLRRSNAFEIHSIDNSKNWIDLSKNNFPEHLKEYVTFYLSDVEMTTFNERICTMYKKLPNICPDLIYLDGPEQFNVIGDVRGISTASPDRLPMSADILIIEPFLLPGTLIITDGRTANARFILNNLQRNWEYCHFVKEDIHAFELVEKPLGKINEIQLDFCNTKIKNENLHNKK